MAMITDEERREVARRLRETGEELGSGALLWYHIAKALGVRTATDGKTACGMLVDLIEPEPERTCKRRNHDTDNYYMRCFSCSRCNAGWFEDINDKPFSYCPHCGAKVVDE